MSETVKAILPLGLTASAIVGLFTYGIMTSGAPENVLALALPQPEPIEEEVTPAEQGIELEYIFIKSPIVATVPKFDGRIEIKISIAHDKRLSNVVVTLIKEAPEKLLAAMSEEFAFLANDAETPNELYDTVPPVFLRILNEQLGDADMPEPIQEVFVSSLLRSQ